LKPAVRPNPIGWILLIAAVAIILLLLLRSPSTTDELELSQVVEMAQAGEVTAIEVEGDKLIVLTADEREFESRKESGTSVFEILREAGVETGSNGVEVIVKGTGFNFGGLLISFLPLILFGALLIYLFRRTRGSLNQTMNFSRSQARQVTEDRPTITFEDVAGVDEAKVELAEIVEFLKNPEKFARVGARIPRGVLLVGPPGTGKTLISKAVAGEAGVAFFSISGSEFVEMFVGVGASRVRDLFRRAKEHAPAILFVDEIDAVGRHRGAGVGGGNDEREQTLNQILVEMDGFDERTNVIVIAATNRPDVLDPALLRPGRFDRRVVLDLPDIKGREAILGVHLKGKPLDETVVVNTLAKQTAGFSGADLANLVNEAAILAARENKDSIGADEFEESVDRVIAGPARRSRRVSDKEKKVIAYHEAGHAIVAAHVPAADPVHKVTIVSRGAAGGYTRLLPEEDRGLYSKGQFEAQMAVMMGGKTAEEIVFGEVTTGASNDLQQASKIARRMVTEFGMSESLGPRAFDESSMVFLGKELTQGRNYSDAIAEEIDSEIGKLLEKSKATAKRILIENRARLDRLAGRLIEVETLDADQLSDLLQDDETEAIPAVGA